MTCIARLKYDIDIKWGTLNFGSEVMLEFSVQRTSKSRRRVQFVQSCWNKIFRRDADDLYC